MPFYQTKSHSQIYTNMEFSQNKVDMEDTQKKAALEDSEKKMEEEHSEKNLETFGGTDTQQTTAYDPLVLSDIVFQKHIILDYLELSDQESCAAYFSDTQETDIYYNSYCDSTMSYESDYEDLPTKVFHDKGPPSKKDSFNFFNFFSCSSRGK
eukprot:Phypoly_transcript_22731.p1 GENE.Phypoly_transcript_22731~~Phypoly_transcript_22731.p1  ORF type:complete len:153 (+),score=13.69 Phypoly_transcript_22731:88-546(+)